MFDSHNTQTHGVVKDRVFYCPTLSLSLKERDKGSFLALYLLNSACLVNSKVRSGRLFDLLFLEFGTERPVKYHHGKRFQYDHSKQKPERS